MVDVKVVARSKYGCVRSSFDFSRFDSSPRSARGVKREKSTTPRVSVRFMFLLLFDGASGLATLENSFCFQTLVSSKSCWRFLSPTREGLSIQDLGRVMVCL